ncbi:hypothetical protein SETIT_2G399600v2 [Setaria italica]|uniref:Uncharacterized protein n=1 Tax=Setaria italica TaxID=4555 RepID=A0A368Q7V6_SETIT|nr:hypothetical protein SETIT_2G399600v2 [Setaria italica]
MPHHRHHQGGAAAADEEAPSPRPSAAGCYAFLTRSHHRASGGYRRLDSALALEGAAAAVRVEVGTTRERAKSVFHVDPAVLEAGPVRRLLAAAGRRAPGGGVAVAVDALLFEHLLWLATKASASGKEGVGGEDDSAAADDLSEIVEFYSQDDDDDGNGGF